MRYTTIKKNILLFSLLLFFAVWCNAFNSLSKDGSPIIIKESIVNNLPRGYAIQASINGHYLSVVFTENLGQVSVEVSSNEIGEVETQLTPTPNGVIIYITDTGRYIVTITLANGDEYYGEFEVMD